MLVYENIIKIHKNIKKRKVIQKLLKIINKSYTRERGRGTVLL